MEFSFLPASLVRIIRDGVLGSPVPIGLVATTLNSYSTQGFKSTAMADSISPVMISGTVERQRFHIVRKVHVIRRTGKWSQLAIQGTAGTDRIRRLMPPSSSHMATVSPLVSLVKSEPIFRK